MGAGTRPGLMGLCYRTWAATMRSTPTQWKIGAVSAMGMAPPATLLRRHLRTARDWVRTRGILLKARHT